MKFFLHDIRLCILLIDVKSVDITFSVLRLTFLIIQAFNDGWLLMDINMFIPRYLELSQTNFTFNTLQVLNKIEE